MHFRALKERYEKQLSQPAKDSKILLYRHKINPHLEINV